MENLGNRKGHLGLSRPAQPKPGLLLFSPSPRACYGPAQYTRAAQRCDSSSGGPASPASLPHVAPTEPIGGAHSSDFLPTVHLLPLDAEHSPLRAPHAAIVAARFRHLPDQWLPLAPRHHRGTHGSRKLRELRISALALCHSNHLAIMLVPLGPLSFFLAAKTSRG